MPLTRQQLRHQAAVARYKADQAKPPTRKQASAWLAPLRRAFAQIRTGEVDSHRGYAITRIHWADDDFARIDHCINGFTAMLDRLDPDFDTGPMKRVSKKLAAGVLLTPEEVDACFTLLAETENRFLTFTRAELKDAAQTEQINIELERMGIKECATG